MAQTITTTQNLVFGEGVITDNNAPRIINLQFDGSFTNDPEFVFIATPKEGIYELTGAPPLTAITVTVTVNQQMLGPGQDFTIDNFDIDAPVMTDAAGGAIINLGARMSSTGTGINYIPASMFDGQITIDVTW